MPVLGGPNPMTDKGGGIKAWLFGQCKTTTIGCFSLRTPENWPKLAGTCLTNDFSLYPVFFHPHLPQVFQVQSPIKIMHASLQGQLLRDPNLWQMILLPPLPYPVLQGNWGTRSNNLPKIIHLVKVPRTRALKHRS